MRWAISAMLLTAILISPGSALRLSQFDLKNSLFFYALSAIGHVTVAVVLFCPMYLIFRSLRLTGFVHLVLAGLVTVWVFTAAPDLYDFYAKPLPLVQYFNNHYIVFDGVIQPFGIFWLATGLSTRSIEGGAAALVFWLLTKGRAACQAIASGNATWRTLLLS